LIEQNYDNTQDYVSNYVLVQMTTTI